MRIVLVHSLRGRLTEESGEDGLGRAGNAIASVARPIVGRFAAPPLDPPLDRTIYVGSLS
jgi:hypothetical protein